MSRASQIIVLCEDKAHDVFVRRFLRNWNTNKRRVRVIPYPEGDGSGKAHVLQAIVEEANALRSRPSSAMLIVVLDADEKRVANVHDELDALSNRTNSTNHLIYIVPKWHIETWLAYLEDGICPNESDKDTYKRRFRRDARSKAAHPLIDTLAKTCHERIEIRQPPPSLAEACLEFEKIRHLL